jgi:hypothetical protein
MLDGHDRPLQVGAGNAGVMAVLPARANRAQMARRAEAAIVPGEPRAVRENVRLFRRARQSARAPDALTTGAQFATSAFTKSPNSPGVVATKRAPDFESSRPRPGDHTPQVAAPAACGHHRGMAWAAPTRGRPDR